MKAAPTNRIIRAYRISRIALHLLGGVVRAGVLFPVVGAQGRQHLARRWAAQLLAILNVRVSVSGEVPDGSVGGTVFVANHISWLDIFLLNSVRPLRYVAKSEVRSWPLYGWFAVKVGTFFIDRNKRQDTAHVNRHVADALGAGDCVGVFPEGTTGDGTGLLYFHASLLQPAVHGAVMVRPVAIRYVHRDGSVDTAPAYVGDLTFGASIAQVLGRRVIHAEMVFLPPVHAHGKTRRELARHAEHAIATQLCLPLPCKKPEKSADLQDVEQTASLPTDSLYPELPDAPLVAVPALTSVPK